jgi:hypothetical protein
VVCFSHFDFEMWFTPQRRTLLSVQKWSILGVFLPATRTCTLNISTSKSVRRTGLFCTFWLRKLFCATTPYTFSTAELRKVVCFYNFWFRSVLHATTACNFWSRICPGGSAPAALAYYFSTRSPKTLEKHTVSRLFYLFAACFDLLSTDPLFPDSFYSLLWLFLHLLLHLSISRKFDF